VEHWLNDPDKGKLK